MIFWVSLVRGVVTSNPVLDWKVYLSSWKERFQDVVSKWIELPLLHGIEDLITVFSTSEKLNTLCCVLLYRERIQSTVGVRLLTQGTDHSEYLNSPWCWINCQMLNQIKSKTKEQGTGPGTGSQERLGTSVRDRDFQGKSISPSIKVHTSSFHAQDWQRLQVVESFYNVLNRWFNWTKLNDRARVSTTCKLRILFRAGDHFYGHWPHLFFLIH